MFFFSDGNMDYSPVSVIYLPDGSPLSLHNWILFLKCFCWQPALEPWCCWFVVVILCVCVCVLAGGQRIVVLSSAHAPLSIFICIKCSCFNRVSFVWSPTHKLRETTASHSWFTSAVLKLLSPDYVSEPIVWVPRLIGASLERRTLPIGNYPHCGWDHRAMGVK